MYEDSHQPIDNRGALRQSVDLTTTSLGAEHQRDLSAVLASYLNDSLQNLFPVHFTGSCSVVPNKIQGLAGSVFRVASGTGSHIVKVRPFSMEVLDPASSLPKHAFYVERKILAELGKVSNLDIPIAQCMGLTAVGLEELPAEIRSLSWWDGLASKRISTPIAILLENLIEGGCQSESICDQERQCKILHELGGYARRIGEIKPSQVNLDKTLKSFKSQLPDSEQFVLQLRKLIQLNFLNEREAYQLEHRSSPLWDCPLTDSLVHTDLNPDNVLVVRNSTISGIIDWEGAVIGPSAFEITRIIDRVEITGYRGVTRSDQSERLEAFMAGNQMTDVELRSMQPLIDAIEITQAVRFLSAWYGLGISEYTPEMYLNTDPNRVKVPESGRVRMRWELVANQFEQRLREILK